MHQEYIEKVVIIKSDNWQQFRIMTLKWRGISADELSANVLQGYLYH